jgi:hypothetical protein
MSMVDIGSLGARAGAGVDPAGVVKAADGRLAGGGVTETAADGVKPGAGPGARERLGGAVIAGIEVGGFPWVGCGEEIGLGGLTSPVKTYRPNWLIWAETVCAALSTLLSKASHWAPSQ